MTLQNDQDPGWWRRGMTRRAITIVVSVAAAFLVVAFVLVAINGIRLF